MKQLNRILINRQVLQLTLLQIESEVNQAVDQEKIKRIRKIKKTRRIRKIRKIERIQVIEEKVARIEKIKVETERIGKKKAKIKKIEKIKRIRAEAEIKRTGKTETKVEAGIERTEKIGVKEIDLKNPSVGEINHHQILLSLSVEDHLNPKEAVVKPSLIALLRLQRQWTQQLYCCNSRTWSCSCSFSNNKWVI